MKKPLCITFCAIVMTVSGNPAVFPENPGQITPSVSEISDVTASDGDSTEYAVLTWASSVQYERYGVFRASSESGDYAEIGTATLPPYNDADAIPGVKYWYKLKGYTGDAASDFSAVDAGYRKIAPPPGLDMDEVMKEKNKQPPRYTDAVQKKKALADEMKLQPYYMHPVKLNLVIFVSRSYIRNGDLRILKNFDAYTVSSDGSSLLLVNNKSPFAVNFASKRFCRMYGEFDRELFDRLVKNALCYCVYTGDRELVQEDGTIYMVPGFEAVGLSTEYNYNSREWPQKTLMFATDNNEYREKMKKAEETTGETP